jgi:hypothetical protein
MAFIFRYHTALLSLALGLAFRPAPAQQQPTPSQQVIQTGALNAPTDVLTQDNQWSALISVLSNSDQDLYIEDPSTNAWLARNAQTFVDRGQYTITLVSFYKTVHACRADQIRAGFSDAAHVDACNNYRYRIRQIAVDAPQNTVTLLFSAMVFTGGTLDSTSIVRESRTRGFSGLDADSQKAVSDTTKLAGQQSDNYIARQQNLH